MNRELTSGSYSDGDVIFLLKLIGDEMKEMSLEERERAIQSGTSYSKMLPMEKEPSQEYIELFHKGLQRNRMKVARCIQKLGDEIFSLKKEDTVLVSLARAGTPAGVLMKRYIKERYSTDVPHYSVSIIRGIGIDENAINYIVQKHGFKGIQFVDGWTGKGAVNKTLKEAVRKLNRKRSWEIDSSLAVITDPGRIADYAGSREDFLIPSACLNSTVSGLMSRTVLNEEYIGVDDFHGAKYYEHLKDNDLSNYFIHKVQECFKNIESQNFQERKQQSETGLSEVEKIAAKYNIDDINFIKPGVGEATRVLLRRAPWKILVNSLENPELEHIYHLAKEKNVRVEIHENEFYACFGLIEKISGETV